MRRALPAEFALVAACCRWPPSDARNQAIVTAASVPIDWEQFERVVARHRVASLAHDGLRCADITAPPRTLGRLAAAATAAVGKALVMARETILLQWKFDEAGLPFISVKGSSLTLLAYGDRGMKQPWISTC